MSGALAFGAGLLFGLGLIVSGMANPERVLAFLDLGGAWDYSLLLALTGAVAGAWPGFRWAARSSSTWLGAPLVLPRPGRADKPLWLGSLLFGVGWGLAGICPGPALVGLGAGFLPAAVYLLGFLYGVELYRWHRGDRD